MTTPDPDPAAPRIRRPDPARTAPDRSGVSARATAAAAASAPDLTGPAVPLESRQQATFDESVATSVKTAYDVLAESIEQGRTAAEHFRTGDYNMRQVPGDVRQLAANLLRLARQLSSTTFDVCEALLSQQAPLGGPPAPGTTPVPPFRAREGDVPAPLPSDPTPAPPSTTAGGAPAMRLGLQFDGAGGAVAHTTALSRPQNPVLPDQISAAPLAPRGPGTPLTDVKFVADLQNGGLLATITVPPGQPGGVYSGAVFAPGQDLPLGLLVVELPAASPATNA